MAELSFPTKDPDVTWTLDAELFTSLCETYPTVDVEAECRKARQWCLVNPSRRKQARTMPRFLVNWLNKASTERALGRTMRRHADIPVIRPWDCRHTPRCPHRAACGIVSARKAAQ